MKLGIGIGIGIAAMLAACGGDDRAPWPSVGRPYCVTTCIGPRDLPARCAEFYEGSCTLKALPAGCSMRTEQRSTEPQCEAQSYTYCVQTCDRHAGECWVSNHACGSTWVPGPGCRLSTVQRTEPPRFDCVPDGGVGGGLDAGPGDR